ncbi:hypothetical protein HYDPIDRAFT_188082 [Hydnomerulius pinastri MD-312]|uniref:Origin recognition complex subunit 2 n=1 Tax=Hydnomerulius pinastri MD-312 TaxID=994086 RepID=A0A0C9W9G1_9AGAM|nr:hypothetical protein HYDPIDRAFT_188082 [Hydnomerulius pinastri MD-312]
MDSDEGSDGDAYDDEQTRFKLVDDGRDYGRPSFDAYFLQASSRSRTSTNVFSSRVLPLTADEYNDAISAYSPRIQPTLGPWDARTAFNRYARELDEGFNLLFYGFGSKRATLNTFATQCLSKKGHVVVVNGFHPNTTLKDVIASIECVPGVADASLPSSSADAQIQRIYEFFAGDAPSGSRGRQLYLVVHNIDAPHMRTQKIKNLFSLLALNPNIHLLASLDRLNAPLMWSANEILARKVSPNPTQPGEEEREPTTPKRGYAFLWHDLTSLAPYDAELAFSDRSSIAGASYASTGSRPPGATTGTGAGAAQLTESAITHVLAAVTSKAKKLFYLLGKRQLANIEAASHPDPAAADASGVGTGAQTEANFGLTYDALFALARGDFVASADTALRALLGEFRDHGLILSASLGGGGGGGSGETLWIPLRKERLTRVLSAIEGAAPLQWSRSSIVALAGHYYLALNCIIGPQQSARRYNDRMPCELGDSESSPHYAQRTGKTSDSAARKVADHEEVLGAALTWWLLIAFL